MSLQRKLNTLVSAIAVVLTCVASLQAAPQADSAPPAAPQTDFETAARNLINDLKAKRFEDVSANFDAKLKSVMSPKAFATLWSQAEILLGKFQEPLESRQTKMGDAILVDVNCRFSRATRSLRISFNAEKQVTGLSLHPPFKATPDANRELIVLKTETGDIHGTLEIPKGEGPFPVVLIIAGSGPTDRNGNQPTIRNDSLKKLSHALRDNQIATLCYDKRGVAASRAAVTSVEKLSFDNFVQDAVDWTTLLNKDKRFSSVSLLGHSQGSLIAAVASRSSTVKVKSVISVAGAANPIQDVLKVQLEPKLTEELKSQAFEIIDQLVAGEEVSPVPDELKILFAPKQQPFLRSYMKYNPVNEFKSLTVPTLVINGTTDIQIGPDSARKLVNANSRATLVLIKDMNHVLRVCKTPIACPLRWLESIDVA